MFCDPVGRVLHGTGGAWLGTHAGQGVGDRRASFERSAVMDEEPFHASRDQETGALIVGGAIDELSVADFREALRDATEDYTLGAVVDLNGVTFLPSLAVGVLLGALARAPGTRVEVDRGTAAHMVLQTLGLDEYTKTGR
jgi:anti-anti-sigma factor